MNVLVFLDGVLKNDSGAPIPHGVALFRSLQSWRRTIILCDKKEMTETWLRQNKITKIDDLICLDVLNVDDEMLLVEHCRAKGPIELLVTSNPELAVRAMESGITVSLFLHPKYIRPEFRPDTSRGAKAWSDLTAELNKQDELYREDPRA